MSDGTLEVHTRLDNLSNEPMPAVIGYHPIYELPDGNRDDWTVSVDRQTPDVRAGPGPADEFPSPMTM